MEDKRDYAWSNIMQSLQGAVTYASMLRDESRFDYERQTVMELMDSFVKQADRLKEKYDRLIHEEQQYE